VIQGIVITIGVLLVYQISVSHQNSKALTRMMVFTTLITANIMLTLVNRSFYYAITTTIKYKNNLVYLIILLNILMASVMPFVPPVTNFLELQAMSPMQIFTCLAVGVISVIWYQAIRWRKRMHTI
jgi:Ca2+-transporting ATPase